MRLYELTESKYVSLEEESLDEIIEKFRKPLKATVSGRNKIYRGMRDIGSKGIINGDMIQRKSANTTNYYTLIMGILPSWRNWPQRDNSLICSSSKSQASAYSRISGREMYVIIPLENQPVAVSPDDDFWTSFVLDRFIPNMSNSLPYFNSEFEALGDDLGIGDPPAESKEEMKKYLELMQDKIDNADTDNIMSGPLLRFFKKNGVLNGLNKAFDPSENDFILCPSYEKYVTGEVHLDNEVFLTGKCLALQEFVYVAIEKKLKENL